MNKNKIMEPAVFRHIPVLAKEVLEIAPLQIEHILDCTLGGGGHSRLLLERFPKAHLYAIDRDRMALAAAKKNLSAFSQRCHFQHSSFAELAGWLIAWEKQFDFVFADIGMSSEQLARPERGFSFLRDGPLDMRMDPENQTQTAKHCLQNLAQHELTKIFQEYGEEKFAYKIAKAIVAAREKTPFQTTTQLADFVTSQIPKRFHKPHFHPATRIFQALRIAVNAELEELEALLQTIPPYMAAQGRFAVISFHSLEDRRVKQTFRLWEDPCLQCSKELPYCICGKSSLGKGMKRKPLIAQQQEIAQNPRSRSAKLRAFEFCR